MPPGSAGKAADVPYNNDKPYYQYGSVIEEDEDAVTARAKYPEIPRMTARDRTNEFANAIRSMQSRTVARAAHLRNPRQARTLQGYSNFMMFSKNMGKNIASTYAKLEKLTLCKASILRIYYQAFHCTKYRHSAIMKTTMEVMIKKFYIV